MAIRIITDSGANLSGDQLAGLPFTSVPLTIQVGDQTFMDDNQLDLARFRAALANFNGKTSSACPSIAAWLTAFADADEVYVVTISAALSGSYAAAKQAAALYLADHPTRRVAVFDSRSAGPAMAMAATQIATQAANGTPFDQVVADANKALAKTDLLVYLRSLNNLAKNGRVRPTLARLAGALGIAVIGTASNDGTFELVSKCRQGHGMKKLVQEMVSQGYSGGPVKIDHVDNPDGATKLANLITKAYPAAQVTIGPCHALSTYYAETGGLMVGFTQ